MGLALAALVAVYVFTGIYTVDQQERGVVFRFGAVQPQLKGPGLHWNPPIIDQVDVLNVTQYVRIGPMRRCLLRMKISSTSV